ncbi:ZINC FINGER CCHC DOMAIN-CONTAINING PROTEIN 8 [Salix purpurea]|uniref:ZINC FINGER CCHC DOMAIN-CONTAINING PROTEIN 8 n=1 Tax=Salix purpurea TaxID=77065 RepID=A0A9Q0WFV9_SALPP|nr:ZINC FINGER CCHC DOMAIN-CONTAINING PROTEIN 8 [Salix purpurea]
MQHTIVSLYSISPLSVKFRLFLDVWPVNLLEVNLLLSSSMGTGNDEFLKSDLGLSDSHSQLSSNETKESKDDEESVVLNEGAVGENEGTKNGESVELNEGTKIQEGFELSEGVIRNDEVIVDSGCSALKVRNTGTEEAATDQSNLVLEKRGIGSEEVCFAVETEVDMDLVDSPVRQVNIEVVDPFIVSKKPNISSITGNVEDCFLDTQNKSLIQQEKVDDIYVSGVKRKRITYDEEQPSVHVMYNSLTRASKKKLEELLQQWSEWHAQQNSLSHDFDEMLQSGEDTYFPALRFGMEKTSAVSFWIENQTRKQQDNGMIPLHSNSVPLYDRGYALGLTSADGPINIEGGLKIVGDAARCFNCGSYNHSLKECPKPRDNAAVNNARKELKLKRNQNSSSRNPTRYYQSSSGGKYDGLKPGSLDTETRKLLGLGELDPPPWLNRMQELGYPPGYLDPDDKDQPSGITIFADGDVNEEQEDGEIMETELPEPKRKMSVEFPGVNAAIPENADQRLWEVGPASSDPCRHQSHHRLNYLSENTGRWNHHEQRQYRDDGPPGVDSVFSPSMSSYPPRYGHYDPSYSSDSPRDLTPAFGRSNSDRGRSAVVYEDFVSHSSTSIPSLRNRSSPQDMGSARYRTDNSQDDYDPDYSYRDYSFDRHRHRSRR